jgi:NAD+ synthase (glutamine-hydrolysing)
MRLVRIGIASVSVKVGDYSGNVDRLAATISVARDQGVHLLVTPELAVSGYSLEDRIWWSDVADRSWDALAELATHCKGISTFIGLPVRTNAHVYNAAAFIHDGAVHGLILKKHLPTHSIFYEGRNWTPGPDENLTINGLPAGNLVFETPYGNVTAEVCEDLWSAASPADARVRAGAEIVCNLSASPFLPHKHEDRRELVLGTTNRLACVYAYTNLLGLDNSRLVFDGGGLIATPEGVITEAPILSRKYWTLETGVVDLDQLARIRAENTTWRTDASNGANGCSHVAAIEVDGGDWVPAPIADYVKSMPNSFFFPDAEAATDSGNAELHLDELYDALVLGLRDYFEKVGVFEKILVALSGGRDSALCLLAAVDAIKALDGGKGENPADRVATVYLPNEAYSSSATQEAAQALAEALEVPFQIVSIADECKIALTKAAELAGGEDNVTPLARQNLQARVRGNMMLNWANSANALLLVTSNLSEGAVGYTTTGGDNQGGYSPIANIPKTLVTRLLERAVEREGLDALTKVLVIPPSAELADDQRDEDDLMPYDVLDDLLYLFARRRMTLANCWRIVVCRHENHDAEQLRKWTADFGRLFAYNQWKREQLPVALKVMDLDLDPKTGFRFPVTQSIDGELAELADATLE